MPSLASAANLDNPSFAWPMPLRKFSRNGALWNVGSDHSGLIPANLITFAHFSTSAVMNA
jgi:hypothetical protein